LKVVSQIPLIAARIVAEQVEILVVRYVPQRRIIAFVGDGRDVLLAGRRRYDVIVSEQHALVGHYAGLLHLGREAYGAQGQDVYASESMIAFLRANGPWSLAVDAGHLALRVVQPGRPVVLARHASGAPRLSVEARVVPHRDEFSDTLAFTIGRHDGRGEAAWRALYLPDVDKWSRVDGGLVGLLEDVDIVFVDGTFFDAGELPGRSLADIPHPFVVETLAALREHPGLRRKVVFTHLNHGNPAADPASAAVRAVRTAGARVAVEGEVVGTAAGPRASSP